MEGGREAVEFVLLHYCMYITLYILFISNPSHPENSSNPINPSWKSWSVGTLCPTRPSVFNKSSILCCENSGKLVMALEPSGGTNGICIFRDGSRLRFTGLTGLKFSRTESTHVRLLSTRFKAPSNNSFPLENIRSCHFSRSHSFFRASRSAEVNATA